MPASDNPAASWTGGVGASWAGTAVAAIAIMSPAVIKYGTEAYGAFRKKKRVEDTADFEVWEGTLGDQVTKRKEAEFDLGVSRKDLKEANDRISVLQEQVASLTADLAAAKRGVRKVADVVKENREEVKDHTGRIETLERAAGSSDSIPTT